MTPITEIRVPIMLDKERIMCFNINAFCAYEQACGKFFLSTVSDLYDALFPDGEQGERATNPLAILRKVSMVDLRALLWSTVHEYDKDDVPHWPLTINQVGRHIQMDNLLNIFTLFLQGQSGNAPSRTELGESRAEVRNPEVAQDAPQKNTEAGGQQSIALPVDAFA